MRREDGFAPVAVPDSGNEEIPEKGSDEEVLEKGGESSVGSATADYAIFAEYGFGEDDCCSSASEPYVPQVSALGLLQRDPERNFPTSPTRTSCLSWSSGEKCTDSGGRAHPSTSVKREVTVRAPARPSRPGSPPARTDLVPEAVGDPLPLANARGLSMSKQMPGPC